MESLKWDDQEKCRRRIIEAKGLFRYFYDWSKLMRDTITDTASTAPTPKSHVPKVEVAKSSSGKCFECKEKIPKGELRIQLKASNFHPQCLKKLEVITGGYERLVDETSKLGKIRFFSSIQGYEFL